MKTKIQLAAVILVITGATSILSCNKDDGNNNTTKTKKELLTTGTWKYTASIISPAYDYYGDGVMATDLFAILKQCEKDDFEIYKTDGTWEYNEGPTKCDPSYPQAFSEPWSFTANETNMFVGTVEHTILELTATTLKLRYSFEDSGITYTEEDTYSH